MSNYNTNEPIRLDLIEEAIADIRAGKIIIVVDDEDRENEGDFICAAEKITPEMVNFMTKEGRGLMCAPLTEDRCTELGLEMMVGTNTSMHTTPFTVSVDLLGHGCTTGISASDRAKTIRALVDPATTPDDLGRPGHIFPLRAVPGGRYPAGGPHRSHRRFCPVSRVATGWGADRDSERRRYHGSVARTAGDCR